MNMSYCMRYLYCIKIKNIIEYFSYSSLFFSGVKSIARYAAAEFSACLDYYLAGDFCRFQLKMASNQGKGRANEKDISKQRLLYFSDTKKGTVTFFVYSIATKNSSKTNKAFISLHFIFKNVMLCTKRFTSIR